MKVTLKSWLDNTIKNDLNKTLGFHSWVIKDSNSLFILPSKVASSRVKLTLFLLEGNPEPEQLGQVHSEGTHLSDFDKKKMTEILTSKKWKRFGFVRNPYDRLISAYKTQVGNTWNQDYKWLIDDIKKHFDYPLSKKNLLVSFRDFVKYLVQSNERVQRDGHFNIQSRILEQANINYDLIGRFETFQEDYKKILKQIDAPSNITATVEEFKNRTPKVQPSLVYDDELANTVYEYYKIDFESFEYTKDSWRFEI